MEPALIVAFVIVFFILLFLSAIFSAAETAYFSTSAATIESMTTKHPRSSKLIKKQQKRFSQTLATILLANNLVNIGMASIGTYVLTALIPSEGIVTLISTLVVTVIVVIFGEYMPKLFARWATYRYLRRAVFFIEFLNYLFAPITLPLSKLSLPTRITNTEFELRHMLGQASKEGVLEMHEATLAQKALDLDSLPISKIMTKARDINYLQSGINIAEAKERFAMKTYSRMPVRAARGGFSGVLLLKDIIFVDDARLIDDFVKPVLYFSRNIMAAGALEELRINKAQMALVTSTQKSQAIIGLITLEDILESLVGEIYDEHDSEILVREIAHHKWVARGDVPMSAVHEVVHLSADLANSELTLRRWIEQVTNRRVRKDLRYVHQGVFSFKVISNTKSEGVVVQITRQNKATSRKAS